jgi:CRISPR/Cas system-associated exonuclease Cas4 (RecB family)
VSVGLDAIAGFAMAVVSEEGLPTHFGFRTTIEL